MLLTMDVTIGCGNRSKARIDASTLAQLFYTKITMYYRAVDFRRDE
jgi:hypothetical protein